MRETIITSKTMKKVRRNRPRERPARRCRDEHNEYWKCTYHLAEDSTI